MNIAFFHSGADTSLPTMFCKSARLTFGKGCNLVQISDDATPQVSDVDKVYRANEVDMDYPMLTRMRAYRDLLFDYKEPIAFFDTDILIVRPFHLNLDEKRPILCRRTFSQDAPLNTIFRNILGEVINFPEHSGLTIGSAYPFVGCFFADKNEHFLDKALAIYAELDRKYWKWFGDQVALRDASVDHLFLEVAESTIACLPEHIRDYEDVAGIHFKGNRKAAMNDFFVELIERTSADKSLIHG